MNTTAPRHCAGTVALIVAAGRGTRARAGGGPKQYALLRGRPMLAWTIDAFLAHPRIEGVLTVIHADDGARYDRAAAGVRFDTEKLMPAVPGGATRQESVRLGLESLAHLGCEHVLIHDAARPFLDAGVIDRVLDGLVDHVGAIAAVPVADTLKRSPGLRAQIECTVPRDGLWRAQTPQGFRFQEILDGHRRASSSGRSDFTDDASIAEWADLEVVVVSGSERNTKITMAEDLLLAERTLEMEYSMAGEFETRTGTGFDVHRFADGDSVWLCGVEIPHAKRLDGHSDADVGLHALTDAILGALGDGDIGQHFPPSDPQWKGARSDVFLKDAAGRVQARGGRIVNVDVTLLCEAPKVGPYREAMRAAIAGILGVDVGRVGVKATTTERLGFTGREEGIAAMASASIALPVAE